MLDSSLLLNCAVAATIAWVAARLILRRWPRKGKWGINPDPVVCPKCQTPAPKFRKPANRRQMLWGGWTCVQCKTECDKYGKPIAPDN
jgi:hypothetical protein